jgi:serine/threonine protein kinase
MSGEEEPQRVVYPIPATIGTYELGETIGEGSFSAVKRAKNTSTGKEFACKCIARDMLADDELKTKFESEIRILQGLQHPGIVRLSDLLRDEHYVYVIMELCADGELFQFLVEKGQTPELFAQIMMRRVLEAVEFIHARGIAHRDMKPENILIDEAGAPKLSDFGFARVLGPDALVSTPCGSPCYASPECLSGEPYDAIKSDIWSLGVMVFVMMTGSFPWTSNNQTQLYAQIKRGDYLVPVGVPRKCADFIRKMMKVDTATRLTATQALAHPWLAGGSVEPDMPFDGPSLTIEQVDAFFAEPSA